MLRPPSVREGDCLEVLRDLPDDSIQLIVTSPPYADSRKSQYGGIHPDEFVDWFLPRSGELRRVLSPEGTFILNLKERVLDGERSDYVYRLILALREQGWRWTEEFIWHKKNSMAGKWKHRFRDAWERVYQLNKSRDFKMHQEAVSVPYAPATLRKVERDTRGRQASGTGTGWSYDISRMRGKTRGLPDNVLHLGTESRNRSHPAVFPIQLPEFFIRLFSLPGETVLDPFLGSGTTLLAARNLGRNGIGIESSPEYCRVARERLGIDLPVKEI